MRSTIHHYNTYSMALRKLGSGSREGEGGPGLPLEVPRCSGQAVKIPLVNKDAAWGASPFIFKVGNNVACGKPSSFHLAQPLGSLSSQSEGKQLTLLSPRQVASPMEMSQLKETPEGHNRPAS